MNNRVRRVKRGMIVDFFPIGSNGNNEQTPPQVAIVTKVLSPDIVNLQVLYDSAQVSAKTSIPRRTTTDLTSWDFVEE